MVLKALIRRNKERGSDLKNLIKEAFLRVRNDVDDQKNVLNQQQNNISNLVSWMNFVYNNHKRLENSHRTLTFQHNHQKLLSKQDIVNLKQWIDHFNRVQSEQKNREKAILGDLEALKDDLRTAISCMEEAKSESSSIKSRIGILEEAKPAKTELSAPVTPKFSIPVQTYQKPEEERSNIFERKILQRIRPNRKKFIIKEIEALLKDGKYSTSDIEEIVVLEKNLCGRTSFFSYLKEMKLKGQVSYAQVADKQILILNEK